METSTTPNLTTAVAILAAFSAVSGDSELMKNSKFMELLKDLAELFIRRPDTEIADCVTKNLDAAEALLTMGYNAYPGGSDERKAVVAKGLSLVDDFVKAGNLAAADAWLARGYSAYPGGSDEEKAVVAKQKQLRQLQSSKQMGAAPQIDFAAIQTAVRERLAEIRPAVPGAPGIM